MILSYLAAHSDFSADLAGHVAQITGAPLHILVHDDVSAFPAARGREASLRRAHETILRSADVCWFVSPELAKCFPATSAHSRILYPLPEGWDRPAAWKDALKDRSRVYYAGHVWPEQLPLLAKISSCAHKVGTDVVIMAKNTPALREFCVEHPMVWQPPFETNREALSHLVDDAAGVVSYADTIADMPWSATSFPSRLVEYCHLGLPSPSWGRERVQWRNGHSGSVSPTTSNRTTPSGFKTGCPVCVSAKSGSSAPRFHCIWRDPNLIRGAFRRSSPTR